MVAPNHPISPMELRLQISEMRWASSFMSSVLRHRDDARKPATFPAPARPAPYLGPRRPISRAKILVFKVNFLLPFLPPTRPLGGHISHDICNFLILNSFHLLCKIIQPVCLLLGYPLPPPCRRPKLAARKGSGRRVRTLRPSASVRLSEAPNQLVQS